MVEHFRAKSLNNSNKTDGFQIRYRKTDRAMYVKIAGKTFVNFFWTIWTNRSKETNDIHGSCKVKIKIFFAHLLMVLTLGGEHTQTHTLNPS